MKFTIDNFLGFVLGFVVVYPFMYALGNYIFARLILNFEKYKSSLKVGDSYCEYYAFDGKYYAKNKNSVACRVSIVDVSKSEVLVRHCDGYISSYSFLDFAIKYKHEHVLL